MTEKNESALSLVPYKKEHGLELLKEPQFKDSGIKDLSARAEACENEGLSFTVLDRDKPIMCGGIGISWSGLGMLWVLSISGLDHLTDDLCRVINTYLTVTAESNHLRRIQIGIPENLIAERVFLEEIGFKFESRMPTYGPKGEVWIMMRQLFGGV
jgi:hypothetical protein